MIKKILIFILLIALFLSCKKESDTKDYSDIPEIELISFKYDFGFDELGSEAVFMDYVFKYTDGNSNLFPLEKPETVYDNCTIILYKKAEPELPYISKWTFPAIKVGELTHQGPVRVNSFNTNVGTITLEVSFPGLADGDTLVQSIQVMDLDSLKSNVIEFETLIQQFRFE